MQASTADQSTCFSCKNPIHGADVQDSVDACGQAYHLACYVCNCCMKPLEDESFVQKQHLFCKTCYEKVFSAVCKRCTVPISLGSKVTYYGYVYHKECYICDSCKTPLGEENQNMYQGILYCSTCLNDVVKESSHWKCDICHTPIYANPKMFSENDNRTMIVHPTHFRCQVCSCKLDHASYIDGFHQICKQCYTTMDYKHCSTCNKIVRGRTMTFRNKHYHDRCFRCTWCHIELKDSVAKNFKDDPYCQMCYTTYAKDKCAYCQRSDRGRNKFSLLSKRWCEDHIFCNVCNVAVKKDLGVRYIDLKILCDKCYPKCEGKAKNDEIETVNKLVTMTKKQQKTVKA